MSRPPRPHSSRSTGEARSGDPGRADYLPLAYAELLGLSEQAAATHLGRPADGRPDVARTLMELSSLVGHVLSVYQRHYAAESFIGTAQTPGSLVRHAHRLAAEPDPGLAASGHVVLITKPSVDGTVTAGLSLASVPQGEATAQDYETQDDVLVDAALNTLTPRRAQRPVVVGAGARQVRLQGVGHGLAPGDVVALTGTSWAGLVVTEVTEELDATRVRFDRPIGFAIDLSTATPPVVLAHPAHALASFGATADPVLFPPSALQAAGGVPPKDSPKFWYTISPGEYRDTDIYLSEELRRPLGPGHVVRMTAAGPTVLAVDSERVATVTFRREVTEEFPKQIVTVTPKGNGFETTVTTSADKEKVTVGGHVAGTVTVLTLRTAAGDLIKRTAQTLPVRWLAGWETRVPLAATEPNDGPVTESVELTGLLPALTPGRPLVFSDPAGAVTQVVAVRTATLDTDRGVTRFTWDPVTPTPPGGWRLDRLTIFGNVVRVSHGRTVRETLASDGVTPFQRLTLRESPITVLSDVSGGRPQVEIRVNGVLWDRVADFALSGPDDRHYRLVTDETQASTVVFGDGRSGAVPPAGRRSIEAVYRVGLGRAGDAAPGAISRVTRAHPLLDRVVNLTAVSGGAEPAGASAIRSQSTRWIRTFDRAVSIADLADLALTIPGIARAAARWDQVRGAVLVVATSSGDTPPTLDSVRAFLDARRDTGIPLVLRGPAARDLVLTVDVEPDPSRLPEAVQQSVRDALCGEAGLFTFPARELGQPAYLSEVYGRLEAVDGVVGVRIRRFDSRNPGQLADVVPADVDEWLRLEPRNLTVTLGTARRAS
ncbi:baseplate J/gp47 family protein [Cryptosporangium aurantiacum]|uniref:Putative baseplate assembly protein n=1 Tax=Cryptosporangium aurantiacum TaxID=134849 RepID=A0A1M7P9V6_9ACTN|nr:baseplate J/gp47 family protein [Cryptosporangium aurantiacum]SHN13519.1 putative baseplate assembly protein [Cryptosporangium aurantiacum]